MSIHVALNHVTRYHYDRPVSLGPQIVRLRPAPHCRTRILSYSMKVLPAKHFINWQQDPQSNYLARLAFPERTREFCIEIDLVAEMSVLNPFDFFLESYAEKAPFSYPDDLKRELAPYLVKLVSEPIFYDYLACVPCAETRTIDFLVDLNQRLQKDIRYLIRLEPGVQSPAETLTKASGSCRDSAWLLVQLLRHLGLASRFVSGYLIQLKPDVKALDGPSGTDVDFTDLHAWCEVYLPGAGWIGLDPTSGLLAGEGHIPVACSHAPSSAAPITGSVDECKVDFSHSMKIERIFEAPRVTKPYSDEQWQSMLDLGHAIDTKLEADDVRLTQGGEPTFVSIDDRDGAEWNTAAMGPHKRRLGADLMWRLKGHYAPGGLLHFGQGKWYPGEQLPRWSLNAFWRKDGEPIWSNPEIYASENIDYAPTAAQSEALLAAIAERLGVAGSFIFPAYEDALYYLWRERRLPTNVTPQDPRLEDPLERQRLRKVFAQGLGKIIGHALPVTRTPSGEWQSGQWFLRDEHCYLIPGDSPMGFRLPLDSLPWARQADFPYVHAPDPTQSFPPLPRFQKRISTGVQREVSTEAAPKPFESAARITRTAICVEGRGGQLHVFMPPTYQLEDYLELVAAVEESAEALGLKVVLEGYEPPRDPRLVQLRVTPDPGVIEVNIQPAASWDELVEQTTFLYEAAHQSRLSSEKFMLDGRHAGTGGGNHFVLGGATPTDSPFLRRPDLLASMISYWHNHPSLSYLFSGLFIGPTSQAPRIDEARNESVYEIDIAFRELQRLQANGEISGRPWLLDRLLRNLLIDVTGNTHRAEFCIDKLFSPDSATGRLGLLELRAFEMPPHAHMSLAQQLLMRGLVARFWQRPYRPSTLKHWGTELHDRFMLPHFIADDFDDVIEEMRSTGFAFDRDWFAPHFEFRFPRVGDFATRNVDVELRMALEPWHVLGEEADAGGTARYVDSTLERLQVKVRGMIDDRHVLTCNGRPLPLHPTGRVGEFVAGVRYRAWTQASSLHPTIPIDAPLVFDLVDTWNNRSMGGCQYHVAHPGGRNYDTFPVNAYEAEARRLARFFRLGHTPGEVRVAPEKLNSKYPFTLDLRRV